MKRLPASLSLAVALTMISSAWCQDDAVKKMTVEKTDGSIVELPYLRFDIAAGTAIFASEDGGETEIPATAISLRSLPEILAKMPPVAAWLDPKKSDVLIRSVGSQEQRFEEEAVQSIYDAATKATTEKEKIAMLQLHGIVHRLMKADHDRVAMEIAVEKGRKVAEGAYQGELYYANRHAVNPVTGRDQKTPWMEKATAERHRRLQACIEQEQKSKRELMVRLASCNIYARYCELSGRAAYAKELDGLRAKITQRSPVAKESEAAGLAMVAWMASRISVHHHNGNNAALLKGMFAKMQTESQVDSAVRMIFFDRPPEDGFKIKAALLAFTGEKLLQSHISERAVDLRLRNGLRETISDLYGRQKAISQIRPFVEEAIRMGSR